MKYTLVTSILILAAAAGVLASDEDDLTSLSYISYLERYATVQPATQEERLEATINMPVVAGDRIDTARQARAEVQLADGSVAWLDEYTSISLDAMALSRDTSADRTVLYLAEGAMILEIPASSLAERSTRIDGSSGTVYASGPGMYRFDVMPNGSLRVEVWEGSAEAATAEGVVLIGRASSADVAGGRLDEVASRQTTTDDFALWVTQRRYVPEGESAHRVDPRHQRQAAILDNYGSWVWVSEYASWAWQPAVSNSWRPYTAGRWYWTPTGWTWVAYEPWGWLPYHYGSWFHTASMGWLWSWDSYWGPAWVDWVWWPGYVGWCPRGYYSYYWWDRYYDGNRHHHPHQQPPRDAVRPRPGGRTAGTPGMDAPVPPSRFAIDLKGVTDIKDIDGRGWSVVAVGDFDNPRLSRVIEPGERAMRRTDAVQAVVRSGPLLTEPPSTASVRAVVDRDFRDIASGSARNLGPVLSRDDRSADGALDLLTPTTTRDLSRRAVADRPAPALSASRPTLSVRTEPAARVTAPNVYRPDLGTSSSSSGDRRTLVRPTQGMRPTVTSPSGASRSGAVRTAPSGTALRPAPRTDLRSIETGSASALRPSRPVIVPRTSPMRPSRTMGSRSTTSGSTSRGGAVPGRSFAPTARAGSRSTPSARSSGSTSSASSSSSSSSSSGGTARSTSGSSAASSRPSRGGRR